MLTDFQNSFTVTFTRKFAMKRSLQIPQHLNGVTTQPCEILMSDGVPYMLGVGAKMFSKMQTG